MKILTVIAAYFRLSNFAICMASTGKRDVHDYSDDKSHPWPDHFHQYTCSRCRKRFFI